MLPVSDQTHLDERFPDHAVSADGGMTTVLLRDFVLPPGFTATKADLLLRLSPGYPDVHPDMWWFDPPVARTDGGPIAATDAREQHLGRLWQRWSRHLSPGQWRPGIDSLESYLALVRAELVSAAASLAA